MDEKPRLELRRGTQPTFLRVLVNSVVVSVVNFTLWFAVTFWVFLETRSVAATRAKYLEAYERLTGEPLPLD